MMNTLRNLLLSLFLILIGFDEAQAGGDTLQPKKIKMSIIGVDTKSAQVALFGNVSTLPFRGAQLACIFNTASANLNGMQASGVFNFAGDSMTGAQLSGCINAASGRVDGLQAAGSLNLVQGDVYGLQASGAANIIDGNSYNCQLAGGLNIAKDVKGIQASGGMNYARNVNGIQASGGLNIISGEQKGLQLSGGLNIARNVKGFQLGVVNFSDSCSGIPFGVFSFVRTGYHKIEIGYNEALPMNVSFRSGTSRFYNIFSFGADLSPALPLWAFGYGVGTEIPLHRRAGLNIDLTNHHVNQGSFSESWSDLYKLHVTLDVKVLKKISLAFGPSLNVFVHDLHPAYGEQPVNSFVPWSFFSRTYSNNVNVKAWTGFEVSIRIL